MKEIIAALSFFTRVPFYKIKGCNVDVKYYSEAINFWPVAGLFTASCTIGAIWSLSYLLPTHFAILGGIIFRVLITGALHEDGLSDFFDGLGGGTTKKRVLEIMKDSHIGVYGVLGLIFYFLLYYQALIYLPYNNLFIYILVADTSNKLLASQISRHLPYARDKESSKAKLVYVPMSLKSLLFAAIAGLSPLIITSINKPTILLATLLPIIVFAILVNLLRRRIQGYTGDCCGAIFLLCELSFYIGLLITQRYITI